MCEFCADDDDADDADDDAGPEELIALETDLVAARSEVDKLTRERNKMQEDLYAVRAQLARAHAERDEARGESVRLKMDRDEWVTFSKVMEETRDAANRLCHSAEKERDEAQAEVEQMQAELEQARAELARLREQRGVPVIGGVRELDRAERKLMKDRDGYEAKPAAAHGCGFCRDWDNFYSDTERTVALLNDRCREEFQAFCYDLRIKRVRAPSWSVKEASDWVRVAWRNNNDDQFTASVGPADGCVGRRLSIRHGVGGRWVFRASTDDVAGGVRRLFEGDGSEEPRPHETPKPARKTVQVVLTRSVVGWQADLGGAYGVSDGTVEAIADLRADLARRDARIVTLDAETFEVVE